MTETRPKAEARLPRGLGDRGPAAIAATHRMLERIRAVYERYGFEAVETPLIEYTDALGKFLPDLDRPNAGVFSFKDDDEQWLSLRYDLTAPLARYVAENYAHLPKPYRSFRAGLVFRNEKPGPGRFRQFTQFDADTVGSASVAADAELCMMAADTLEALGIRRGDYVIKVNNRKVLDGVMEAIGLGGEANAGRRLTVLRAFDKIDRLGLDGVRALLGSGRRDESGDFTKGAGLSIDHIDRMLAILSAPLDVGIGQTQPVMIGNSGPFGVLRVEDDDFSNDMERVGPSEFISNLKTLDFWQTLFEFNETASTGINELRSLIQICEGAGYGSKRIRIDSSVIRGLEYYTGPVFEAELTFEVRNEDGRPVRFGSVGGGGRYDGLVGRFRGEPVPATGFSIGVSRLQAALEAIGSPLVAGHAHRGPVVVLLLDRDQVPRTQRLVTELRQAGIAAELYLGQSGMNAQLKYADKRGSVCAVIQGSNERDHADGPQVVVRDLVLGAELAKATKDRADYVELRARAQATVPEAELVRQVRAVLDRHAPGSAEHRD